VSDLLLKKEAYNSVAIFYYR